MYKRKFTLLENLEIKMAKKKIRKEFEKIILQTLAIK
jgi:hypothetical protein